MQNINNIESSPKMMTYVCLKVFSKRGLFYRSIHLVKRSLVAIKLGPKELSVNFRENNVKVDVDIFHVSLTRLAGEIV